jgi:predicted dienelactone hydrolase
VQSPQSARSLGARHWRTRSAAARLAAALLLAPALAVTLLAAPAPAPAGAAAGTAALTGARAPAPAPGPAAGPTASRFTPNPGPYAVEALNLDWFDRDRNRQVPARIYFPRRASGPFPVVVFSSGIGAGRNSFEFLDRHLASHGYISVQVQHAGTDDQAAKAGGDGREALAKAARDPQTGLTRLLDLVFALDQVGALAASSPVLRGRIDLGAVAVGGHNLGAWTALAAAGLAFTGPDGEESSLPDPRVKAALLFVPPPPPPARRDKMRFEHVKVPCLHVVGAAAAGESDPQAAGRRVAFDQISGADQVLVTVVAAAGAPGGAVAAAPGQGASSSGGAARGVLADAAVQGRLKVISTAFLDAALRHDPAAKSWLAGGGLATYLGDGFRVETRAK